MSVVSGFSRTLQSQSRQRIRAHLPRLHINHPPLVRTTKRENAAAAGRYERVLRSGVCEHRGHSATRVAFADAAEIQLDALARKTHGPRRFVEHDEVGADD